MKIAVAQINTTVGDLRGNCAKIREFHQRGAAAGAALVLAPELAITGYPPRDLLAKHRFVEDNLRALDELAAAIGPTALLVGYVDVHRDGPGRGYYNACALIQDGRIRARRFKTLLPTYDVFDEDRYFQPADANPAVPFDGRRLGLTICEDIWNVQEFAPVRYPRDPIAGLMQDGGGIDLLLNISASPYHDGKEVLRHDLLQKVAEHHHVPLVYANLVGGNDELVFDGNSLAFDGRGNLIGRGAPFREDLLVVDVPERGPDPAARPADAPRPGPLPFAPLDPIEAIYEALVLGLRDYAHKCGFKSAVLGLSGGIDSAVTACLAVAALGHENVRGLSLPSQFSSPGSIDDARDLAGRLEIRWDRISIREVFESFRSALRPLFSGLPEDTTEENIQARVRGTLLMAISNKHGDLLLTTGNKSEMAVGYCTLYGDMAGGLAVIADVPKTMVYQLGRHLNRPRPLIPEACFTKPPSAELRPDQTDQDSLPPYEVLDAILKKYIEEFRSAAEIVAETGLADNLVRDIVRKIDLNEYKRKQAPPCLRVTTKAFGIGRRVPIAQRYVER